MQIAAGSDLAAICFIQIGNRKQTFYKNKPIKNPAVKNGAKKD